MMLIVALGWLAALGAAVAFVAAGALWLDVAKQGSASDAFRHAARLTGGGMISGAIAFLVLVGSHLN